MLRQSISGPLNFKCTSCFIFINWLMYSLPDEWKIETCYFLIKLHVDTVHLVADSKTVHQTMHGMNNNDIKFKGTHTYRAWPTLSFHLNIPLSVWTTFWDHSWFNVVTTPDRLATNRRESDFWRLQLSTLAAQTSMCDSKYWRFGFCRYRTDFYQTSRSDTIRHGRSPSLYVWDNLS
jgi:hypothetical protein